MKLGSTHLCSPTGKYQYLILQKPISPHTLIYRMHSILFVFVPMAEEKIPKTKALSDQLSDSDTPDEEADPHLHTSQEQRSYGMIRGSTQATQAALSHSRAQTNLTVERDPPRIPKIKDYLKIKQQKRAPRLRTKKNKCDKH